MTNRKTIKAYVLIRKDASQNESNRRIVAHFADGTDIESYGEPRGFGAAIGPFQTDFAATLMADFGENNPHMQTVEDCERIADRYWNLAGDAIEQAENGEESDAATAVFDVCADRGQIFSNVKHMEWFREAVAYQLFCDSDMGVQL